MRPSFYPRLVNGPFDDPGLFISFIFKNRAILFDLGDIYPLSAKDVLKVSHVFVTHTHMDHFAGFDRLLRLFLGRDKSLYLYGPEGFIKNVEGKLSGYTWNLVNNYQNSFIIHVTEVNEKKLITKEYECNNRFVPAKEAETTPFKGVLLEDPCLSVHAKILDHKIPCLGFTIKEKFHVNIMKDSLLKLGLETGPWLRDFKEALFFQKDPDTEIDVESGGEKSEKRKFKVNDLKNKIALITEGQKISYVSDVVCSRTNIQKIIELAKDADHLFIEAVFLEQHKSIAKKKYHLTARQAGYIAAASGVKQFTIFHHSPRYHGKEHLLQEEAMNEYLHDFGKSRIRV